jgi:hypothetical protein
MSREKPYILLVDPEIYVKAHSWFKKNPDKFSYISMENHYSSEDFQDIIEFATAEDRTMFALKWL